MWIVNGNDLSMAEDDFGVILPITVNGATFSNNDVLRITIGNNAQTAIVTKTYTPSNNTINFELTEAEAELLPIGTYLYSLDWYQNGVFMCNIIPRAIFRVVDKV